MLANIFISEIENKIMNELRNKGVLSWMRYVDDCSKLACDIQISMCIQKYSVI